MSGLEEASLALAVLPLLVSLTETYRKVCRQPFVRFKNFSRVARQYLTRLNNQQVIYRTHCLHLLSSVIEEEVAKTMLSDGNHPWWRDQQIDEKVARVLGEREEACSDTVRDIEDILKDIIKEAEDILSTHEKTLEKKHQLPLSTRMHHVRKKLDFAFSDSRLGKDLDNLTALNSEFRQLCPCETSRVELKQAKPRTGQAFAMQKIHIYCKIAEASQELYEALKHVCGKHTKHEVHLCVQAETLIRETASIAEVEFKLAFANADAQNEPAGFEIRIMVCEVAHGELHEEVSSSELIATLKRQLSGSALCAVSTKPKKRVRLDLPCQKRLQEDPEPSARELNIETSCTSGDLCDFLRRWALQQSLRTQTNFLTSNDRWRKTIYPLKSMLNSHSNPISLHRILSMVASNQDPTLFSVPQRIRLAKLLAVGFLRHYSTDWGRRYWQSKHIFFFDLSCDATNQPLSLPPPHLNARISKSLQAEDPEVEAIGARNQLLFSLAIMLLEIAHLKEWANIKAHYASSIRPRERACADLIQARRLANGTSAMPGEYHRVVAYLVDCDFGHGNDLSNQNLRAAFHESIVDPLDELETRFAEKARI